MKGEHGQAATEYLMILGLLTAMIIALTGIIVPTISYVVVRVVKHVAVFVSST
jgi:Flp pilus assembly pilin Flp